MEHKHDEAYSIIEYKCNQCHRKENIWNSADIQKPELIPCPICKVHGKVAPDKGMMLPTGTIEYDPEHIPLKRERVIIELTEEMSLLYNKVKAGQMWNIKIEGRKTLSETFDSPYNAALAMHNRYKKGIAFVITL